jgi:hypothetical protein
MMLSSPIPDKTNTLHFSLDAHFVLSRLEANSDFAYGKNLPDEGTP